MQADAEEDDTEGTPQREQKERKKTRERDGIQK
jgi:hypothetical protein